MEKKEKNHIKEKTITRKDLPGVQENFNPELGEAVGSKSAMEEMKRRGEKEAEEIVERYEKNGIKTI